MQDKFRILDDDKGTQLKRDNYLLHSEYFMGSSDKIRFFFDPKAYDHDGKLVDGRSILTDYF